VNLPDTVAILPESDLQELIMNFVLFAKSSDPTDQRGMYKMAAGWVVVRTGIKIQVSVGRFKVNLIAQSHQFGLQIPSCALPHTACFILVSCLAYSSSLKMEMIRSSETSVDFY
jgi:hypothetical protein